MENEKLRLQYLGSLGNANLLRSTIVDQLSRLIEKSGVTLGVPMESRVKDWSSVEGKMARKNYSLTTIQSLDDLVGVRIILLFKKDEIVVPKILRDNFIVESSEDASNRLSDSQFGYQSQHFILRLRDDWLAVPSFSDLGGFRVEVQVRTLAQHIWAAASHKLQYKHEASVPAPMRRTINRVSALLEIVDLEFDRVRSEREEYRESEIVDRRDEDTLNVDLVRIVLSDLLPAENMSAEEPYDDLVENLFKLNVTTVGGLRTVVCKHFDQVMFSEGYEAASHLRTGAYIGTTKERVKKGVFFTHVGLAREALKFEFGHDAVWNSMGYEPEVDRIESDDVSNEE